MAKLVMDWDNLAHTDRPRRGDIVQSAKVVYHVIAVREIKRRNTDPRPRFSLTVLRQDQIEPEMEAALERSAARRGGRRVIHFNRYTSKKKRRTFEDLMRGI